MAQAHVIRYPLRFNANGTAIELGARMLYFRDEKIALVPTCTLSQLGRAFNIGMPKVLHGEDARAAYNQQEIAESTGVSLQAEDAILAWAKLYPETEPSLGFQQKILSLLVPFQLPSYADVELLAYRIELNGGLEQEVQGIYIPVAQAFVVFHLLSSENNRVEAKVTGYYGVDAVKQYLEAAELSDEIKPGRIAISALELIIESSKQAEASARQQFLTQFIAAYLSNPRK